MRKVSSGSNAVVGNNRALFSGAVIAKGAEVVAWLDRSDITVTGNVR